MEYKKSQSTVRPDPIDMTSSKTTIYLRKNIIEKQETDEASGETVTVFEYDEAKLTKSEYEEYEKAADILDIRQQRADIDYIALMIGIDLGDE